MESFSVQWLLNVFQLTPYDWFIKSYFVLMIIAPVLNTYSKNVEEKTQRYVMIAFFLFEAIYGWVMGGRRFFVDGYGPLHFIGLYITAQYIHNQVVSNSVPRWLKSMFTLPKQVDLLIYIFTVLLNTTFVVIGSKYMGNTKSILGVAYAYSNPLVVIGALYLLLFFSKLKLSYSKVVNWFGASSFAVYLFHSETTVRNSFFTPQIQYIYSNYSGGECVGMMAIFLTMIYLVSVALDQLRKYSWKYVCLFIR